MPNIETERVSLDIADRDGAILQLSDKTREHRFVDQTASSVPLRIHLPDGIDESVEEFVWSRGGPGGNQLTLRWRCAGDITVTALVAAGDDGASVAIRLSVENRGERAIVGVEYPVLGGLTRISSDGSADRLVHPYATGFMVHDPFGSFTPDKPGLRYVPYPEGFSGATAQFFTYYADKQAGFTISTLDGDFAGKWLNFYKAEGGFLEASVIHGNEAVVPGGGFEVGYPTEIALLDEPSWYTAADRYKRWAVSQRWCRGGLREQRAAAGPGARLYNQVGAATFGIDARYDRSQWIRAYREHVGTPLLHVLGPDWPKIPRDYGRTDGPGPLEEWFPTAFDPNNITAIGDGDDLMTPFEFDYLFPEPKADSLPDGAAAFQQFPQLKRSFDEYRFPFLCPTTESAKQLHIDRDAALAAGEPVDGVYYDISANNILRACTHPEHDHPPGSAARLTNAYRDTYAATRAAMEKAGGRPVLLGTEMINEVFVDLIDFYQARAGAQPAAAFEGGPLRHLITSGRAELVPVFAYLYHEYGPVRLDGWGKVVAELGELFYTIVARVYLWGGLFEINAEFSPMEVINGRENPPAEHYVDFAPRGFAFDTDRAAYIRQFAAVRTGLGRPYLAFGRMLRPPEFAAASYTATWFSYNCPTAWAEYEDHGELRVPSVIASAWAAQDGSVAWFFANTSGVEQQIRAYGDRARFGLPETGRLRIRITVGEKGSEAYADDAPTVDICVPARSLAQVTIGPE